MMLKGVLWREEKDYIQGKRKVGGDLKFSKWFVMKQKLECHATWCNNKRTDKGSMEKWNPGRRNITEKIKTKSNEKGGSGYIVDEGGEIIGEIQRGIEKKLKNILKRTHKRNKQQKLVEEELESEILKQYSTEDPEMPKTVLLERKFLMRKVLSGLLIWSTLI